MAPLAQIMVFASTYLPQAYVCCRPEVIPIQKLTMKPEHQWRHHWLPGMPRYLHNSFPMPAPLLLKMPLKQELQRML